MSGFIGTPDKNGIYFSVTTMVVDDNRSLKKPAIDKDGYYIDVPAAVLGKVSRNKTCYDPEYFVNQLKGPSTFHKRIVEGVAAGEHGHPFIPNPNSAEGLARLLHIEPTRESIHIRSVSVKHIDDLGIDMVLMDVKPSGPYGKYFEESMIDPSRNTAFSLRALSKAHQDNRTGVIHKKIVSFVTFDSCVVGSGFKESTKRYMDASRESLGAEDHEDISCEIVDHINCGVNPDDLIVLRSRSFETFTDGEMNEIIKSKRVTICNTEVGIVNKSKGFIVDNEGNNKSLFGTFMQVKGRH